MNEEYGTDKGLEIRNIGLRSTNEYEQTKQDGKHESRIKGYEVRTYTNIRINDNLF